MFKQFYIYIMANKGNTVLYTGVTSDLCKRLYEHKSKLAPGFTARYNINKLVYFEVCDNAESAIVREKQIKAGSRVKKIKLIESMNKEWKDLSKNLFGDCFPPRVPLAVAMTKVNMTKDNMTKDKPQQMIKRENSVLIRA